MNARRRLIDDAFDQNLPVTPELQAAVEATLKQLDNGELRVCSQDPSGTWTTHAWLKKAILLYFRMRSVAPVDLGGFVFVDKVPLKHFTGEEGVRVVPHALVRYGSHIERGCVLMPSYVNIGAYVGAGTMVDTWATVGSCAQIGKNVHLSGGVGIGGVLEPAQADPVIIEDEAFIGSRCIVVEGVRVGRRAVLGAGVVLTASSPILDVTQKEAVQYKGYVPEDSVVIMGSRTKKFPAGDFDVACPLIIGKRTARTDEKTALNQALRAFNLE